MGSDPAGTDAHSMEPRPSQSQGAVVDQSMASRSSYTGHGECLMSLIRPLISVHLTQLWCGEGQP